MAPICDVGISEDVLCQCIETCKRPTDFFLPVGRRGNFFQQDFSDIRQEFFEVVFQILDKWFDTDLGIKDRCEDTGYCNDILGRHKRIRYLDLKDDLKAFRDISSSDDTCCKKDQECQGNTTTIPVRIERTSKKQTLTTLHNFEKITENIISQVKRLEEVVLSPISSWNALLPITRQDSFFEEFHAAHREALGRWEDTKRRWAQRMHDFGVSLSDVFGEKDDALTSIGETLRCRKDVFELRTVLKDILSRWGEESFAIEDLAYNRLLGSHDLKEDAQVVTYSEEGQHKTLGRNSLIPIKSEDQYKLSDPLVNSEGGNAASCKLLSTAEELAGRPSSHDDDDNSDDDDDDDEGFTLIISQPGG